MIRKFSVTNHSHSAESDSQTASDTTRRISSLSSQVESAITAVTIDGSNKNIADKPAMPTALYAQSLSLESTTENSDTPATYHQLLTNYCSSNNNNPLHLYPAGSDEQDTSTDGTLFTRLPAVATCTGSMFQGTCTWWACGTGKC